MAEVNANSLPAKTDLGTNDSAIVVDQTTNAGALVDLDVLADKVLDRITSKTFANQVGGSSAATLLAQLSTLNSKIPYVFISAITANNFTEFVGNLSERLYSGNIFPSGGDVALFNTTWDSHDYFYGVTHKRGVNVYLILSNGTDLWFGQYANSAVTRLYSVSKSNLLS